MKIFILCGGFGTRLDRVGKVIAKPMVRIGKVPLLMHIIENFVDQGFYEFVLCVGHKSNTIKNYFLKEKKSLIKKIKKEKKILNINFFFKKKNLIIDIIDTGTLSGTGGRIKIAYKKLKLKEDIFMTYGDGLANVNIKKLINFHYRKKSFVTMTAVRPKLKYGIIKMKNDKIVNFDDSKSKKSESFINGGFFVISKYAIDFIKNYLTFWENEPLKQFIKIKKVFAYKHLKFWQSIDTLKDLNELNHLYKKKLFLWKFIKEKKY